MRIREVIEVKRDGGTGKGIQVCTLEEHLGAVMSGEEKITVLFGPLDRDG